MTTRDRDGDSYVLTVWFLWFDDTRRMKLTATSPSLVLALALLSLWFSQSPKAKHQIKTVLAVVSLETFFEMVASRPTRRVRAKFIFIELQVADMRGKPKQATSQCGMLSTIGPVNLKDKITHLLLGSKAEPAFDEVSFCVNIWLSQSWRKPFLCQKSH